MIRCALLCALLLPAALPAQHRGGVTGAQVLQFLPGARAPVFLGAYTAVSGDADAVFYNPAGIGTLRQAITVAYERYVSAVGFGSAGAATRIGAFTIGASVAYLDAGTIREVVPDLQFGGTTGMETGATIGSSETALRILGALPLGDRLRIGGAFGFVTASLAEQQQSTAFADFGAQYDVGRGSVGIAARNIGPKLTGDGAEDYLPGELRLGGTIQLVAMETVVLNTAADLVFRVGEGAALFVGGLEIGLPVTTERPYQLLARAGFDAEQHRVGAFRLGGTIGLRDLAFDYSVQDMEHFGSVHRVGLRLNRFR
jgi:hypothetical protein